MSTVAQRLNGDGAHGPRQKDDFYPTPPAGIEALIRVEKFDGAIWEPACGDGAISRALEAAGYAVTSTDLVDRGFGQPRIDFLMERQCLAPNIVTNPPFKMATEFAWKALDLGCLKLALLVQLRFLEGIDREKLFKAHAPSRVWVFSRRLPMPSGDPEGSRGGMLAFAWFVWERGAPYFTKLGWI